MSIENPGFLKEKYSLHTAPEVESAAKRTEARTGREFPLRTTEDANARIQNYLDRFKEIIDRENPDKQERGVEALKYVLHNKFVIKPEEIPEAYFDSVKRKHREEGHGDIEIPDDYRQELSETLIHDQERSLDNWIDYFASDDAKYPDWLKYYATRSVLRMGRYDKAKKSFTERTGGAIAPFPDLNREALVIVLEAFERQSDSMPPKFGYDIQEGTKQQFLKFLKDKNFAKLYALAVEEFKPIAEALLEITAGEWVTYPKGSDPQPLVQSISEYGTGWCLRGEAMAERYLVRDKNDLHVYYSHDLDGKPTVPRVVMVVNAQGQLAEVRGVAPEENLDPHIGPVVQAKLKEFPDGAAWEKKSTDMKWVTAIEAKLRQGQNLTKEDLIFLYEIDSPIEGFGYSQNGKCSDPRIAELRAQRNLESDMPIVFDCTPGQIAHKPSDIKEGTKAYVGPLEPGIFDHIQAYNIEHIYTAFPEGRIHRDNVEIGGKTAKELEREVDDPELDTKIDEYARDMLRSKEFVTAKNPERVDLVWLTVQDIGFPRGATTDEIYAKAQALGLDLCPAEVGPHLRLKDAKQPMGERYSIVMKQITVSYGRPLVFREERYRGSARLGHSWAGPGNYWDPGHKLVFRLRPSTKLGAGKKNT